MAEHRPQLAGWKLNNDIKQNTSHVATVGDLKAKLQRSAKKLPEINTSMKVERIMHEKNSHHSSHASSETQYNPDPVMESKLRKALESQADVIRELCTKGAFREAHLCLRDLIKVAPEVMGFAEFWETALLTTKDDPEKTAACLLFAIDHIHRSEEKEFLIQMIRNHFQESSGENIQFTPVQFFGRDDHVNIGARKLIFSKNQDFFSSPHQKDMKENCSIRPSEFNFESPNHPKEYFEEENLELHTEDHIHEVKPRESLKSFSLQSVLKELPKFEETPPTYRRALINNAKFQIIEDLDFPPGAKIQTPTNFISKRLDKVNETNVRFGSPPLRIRNQNTHQQQDFSKDKLPEADDCNINDDEVEETIEIARLESRSPARNRSLLLFGQKKENIHGSVIVLSPVKESSKSQVKVATPVRRSARKSSLSLERKNKLALETSSYKYAPNLSIPVNPYTTDEKITSTSKTISREKQRRSCRKSKSVDRYSPI